LVGVGLLDRSGRFVPEEDAAALAPGLAGRLTTLGAERVFVLHWLGEPGGGTRSIYLSPRGGPELHVSKAPLAPGREVLPPGGRAGAPRRPAGIAGRVVRQLPVAGQRDPARPGPPAARASGRQRGQRGRRGSQDGPALGAGARRGAGAAGGGEVCRALRPQRL